MARHALTNPVWAADDTSSVAIPASALLRSDAGRNPTAVEARLANQFVNANLQVLSAFDVRARIISTPAGGTNISLFTSSKIGALSLKSPVTGDVQHGLIIRPRFGWGGIGNLLSATGAKISPSLLQLPQLPRSELGVPAWVMSSIVLSRLTKLLNSPRRRFVPVTGLEDHPRGRVDWTDYVSRRISAGHPEQLLCHYSTLGEDAQVASAIHATALKQIQSLASVRTDAVAVRRLIRAYETVVQKVRWSAPCWHLSFNASSILESSIFREAVEAMNWTRDDRGLAGLSPIGGLPWMLPMEQVFEVWTEAIVRSLATRTGGIVRTGRLRETLRPLSWSPPYTGSQRYLLPDVELVREDETFIFDAKYKSHWEELDENHWLGLDNYIREAHRSDLLQVLAYAGATDAKRITCVLLYPCKESTWASLLERERFMHVAEIPAGSRMVRLALVAIPIGGSVEAISAKIQRELLLRSDQ